MRWLRGNRWNRVIYAIWAPVYDVLAGNSALVRGRQRAFELIALRPGETVLLVGVGTGEDLKFLPAGVTAVGVDLSRAMLAQARRKPVPNGVELVLREADAIDLPFENGEFDVVVLTLILSVVSDGARALREAVRVTREEGRILVFDKFVQEGRAPSIGRRLLNVLTSIFGTDINRRFESMKDGLPVRVVRDEPSLFSGVYRAIVLERTKD